MVERQYFRLVRDRQWGEAGILTEGNFNSRRYPYFMEQAAFEALDDGVAFYRGNGWIEALDFVFAPTFLIGDRFERIFHYLAPEIQMHGLQLYEKGRETLGAMPAFWVPYLPFREDILHEATQVVQGKAEHIVLKGDVLGDARILHTRLPADDIWLVTLEAAECILRRAPGGVQLEPVEVRSGGKER